MFCCGALDLWDVVSSQGYDIEDISSVRCWPFSWGVMVDPTHAMKHKKLATQIQPTFGLRSVGNAPLQL